jgi:hypothetical protein
MPTIRQIVFGLVISVGTLFPGYVLADRAPTPQERSRIETVLRNEGFTGWGTIAHDDGDDAWEVDDAHGSDGLKYVLRLDSDTFAIIQREPDVLSFGQLVADRTPSAEEQSRIETVLRIEGYTRWGKIELDDDDEFWEVDDAYGSDGLKYALKLNPDTFAIIHREPDHD